MTSTFVIFVVLNVLNVIIQTVKSLVTVKCGKWAAALVNAVAYGLYTVVLVYMNCDMPLWEKVIVVGGANLVGVFVVKYFEEKGRKDRLWHFSLTALKEISNIINKELIDSELSFNCVSTTGKYDIYNVYSKTQEESKIIIDLAKKYNIKYFASETKEC